MLTLMGQDETTAHFFGGGGVFPFFKQVTELDSTNSETNEITRLLLGSILALRIACMMRICIWKGRDTRNTTCKTRNIGDREEAAFWNRNGW